MEIIIDCREQKLIDEFQKLGVPIFIKSLDIGDIHICYENNTTLIIERKTVNDLYASIHDGRHREQKARLLSSYASSQCIYLLEGTFRRNDHRYSILRGALLNTQFRDKIQIINTYSVEDSVQTIITLKNKVEKSPQWFSLHQENQSHSSTQEYYNTIKIKKKENMTPFVCQILFLSQIPGISKSVATKILENTKSISNLVQLYQTCATKEDCESLLRSIELKTNTGKLRKLGPILSKRVYEYTMNIQ